MYIKYTMCMHTLSVVQHGPQLQSDDKEPVLLIKLDMIFISD